MDQTKQAQANFIEFLKSKNNGLCNFLITIRIETILTAVIVFIAVMILQLIVVNVLAGLLSIDGAGAECAALVLIVLEAMYIFGGGAESVNLESLKGSFFGLDNIYLNNPLSAIFRI